VANATRFVELPRNAGEPREISGVIHNRKFFSIKWRQKTSNVHEDEMIRPKHHQVPMAETYRHTFYGAHRQLRLPTLRLGQDWQVEVRPLSLTPQFPKSIHIKSPKQFRNEKFRPSA
jgi:hypothetical protein